MRVYEYVHNRTLCTASTITNISVVFMTKRKLGCLFLPLYERDDQVKIWDGLCKVI